jgi:hypothetical protein
MINPRLRTSGALDEFGEPLWKWRDLDAEQRTAEAAHAKRRPDRRTWRYRVNIVGELESKLFRTPGVVPKRQGWVDSPATARELYEASQPKPQAPLPAVIPLPAPPRYRRNKPRCGALTRKGYRCQAQGLGKGGRCRNHGGMSTGPRTAEGRQRCREAAHRRWRTTERKPVARACAHVMGSHVPMQGVADAFGKEGSLAKAHSTGNQSRGL